MTTRLETAMPEAFVDCRARRAEATKLSLAIASRWTELRCAWMRWSAHRRLRQSNGDSLEVCEASRFSIRPAERSNILKTSQFGWQPGNAKSTSLAATTATSSNLLTNINDRNDRNILPRNIRDAPRIQIP